MAKDSIELSPKYGLNPTIKMCFYCGEESGEIAIMGRIRERGADGRPVKNSDIEAPRQMLLDYQPCEKCKEKLKDRFLIYRTESAEGRLPVFARNRIATAYVGIPKEKAKEFLDDCLNISEEEKEQVIEKNGLMLDNEGFDLLFKESEK